MTSTTNDRLRTEIERLMDAYWTVSSHNRDEKRPIYSKAIMKIVEAELQRRENQARIDELENLSKLGPWKYARIHKMTIVKRIAELKATIRKEGVE